MGGRQVGPRGEAQDHTANCAPLCNHLCAEQTASGPWTDGPTPPALSFLRRVPREIHHRTPASCPCHLSRGIPAAFAPNRSIQVRIAAPASAASDRAYFRPGPAPSKHLFTPRVPSDRIASLPPAARDHPPSGSLTTSFSVRSTNFPILAIYSHEDSYPANIPLCQLLQVRQTPAVVAISSRQRRVVTDLLPRLRACQRICRLLHCIDPSTATTPLGQPLVVVVLSRCTWHVAVNICAPDILRSSLLTPAGASRSPQSGPC